MLLKEKTAEIMRTMAESALSGAEVNIPGVSAQRAAVYRDLVLNAFQDTLERAFPLARAALGQDWLPLVEDFVASGPKTSPLLWKMPHEFLEFVAAERSSETLSRPWLDEMLSFEWMEIELYMMADPELPQSLFPFSDAEHGRLVLNPVSEVQAYQFPVFLSVQPEELSVPGKFFLLGFRHSVSNKIHFVELSPKMVLVLEALSERPSSVSEVLKTVREEKGVELERQEIEKGLQELFEVGMILGIQQGDAS